VEDMRRTNREVKAPTFANMIEGGKTPLLTPKELQEIGYSVVAYPLSTLYAAAWAARIAMQELFNKGTTAGCMDKMVFFNDFNRLLGLEKIRETEAYYYKTLLGKDGS
jgi:methylisocitrate lyase